MGKGEKGLSQEQIEEIEEAFKLFDVGSSGSIDYRELKAAMKALGVVVDKAELRKMITDVDADGSGSVEFPEFLTMMTAKMGDADTKEEIMKTFKMFDTTTDGTKLKFDDFKKVAKDLGENMSDDQMHSMFDHADQGGKGYVSFDDFYRLMKKKSKPAIDDLLGDDDVRALPLELVLCTAYPNSHTCSPPAPGKRLGPVLRPSHAQQLIRVPSPRSLSPHLWSL